MKTMGISEFKAHCIQILKNLQKEQTPLIITHRDRPVARIEPVVELGKRRVLGALRDLGRIHGDIVHTDLHTEWEMEQE